MRISVLVHTSMEVGSENPHDVAEALLAFSKLYPGLLVECEVQGTSMHTRSGDTLKTVFDHFNASCVRSVIGERPRLRRRG